MARTVAQAIASARGTLNDEDAAGYRYSDAKLLEYAVDALNALRNVRPDLFLGNWGAITLADTTANLPVNDQFFQALVFYIIGRAELTDDEHAISGRATAMANLLQGFVK